MKYVKSKVTINRQKVKQLTKGAVKALGITGEALLADIVSKQVMPFGDSAEHGGDTHQGGTLQNEGTFVDHKDDANGKVNIISNTPYARRLYYHPEYNFRTKDNPNAGGKWFDPWLKGGRYQNYCTHAYKKFYKQYGGV